MTSPYELQTSNHDSLQDTVAQEVAAQYESFRTNPTILELVNRLAVERSVEIPDPSVDDESFTAATQATFDFRNGKAREELNGGELSQEVKDLTEQLIDELGLRRDTEPLNPDFDAVIILGGAGITPLTRLEYALELEEKGKINAPVIVMAGGERPVNDAEIDRIKTGELARTGTSFDLSEKNVTTEFDLMKETAALKLDIKEDEWEYFSGDDPTIPHDQGFHTNYRVARAYKNNQQILITSAAMLDEDRYNPNGSPRNRANTVDSLLMISDSMGMGGGIQSSRACIVTNAVFTQFQGADAKKALTPSNVEVETVGMTRAHSNLAEWQGGDIGYYIQETLSTIRAVRFARDRLTQSSEL